MAQQERYSYLPCKILPIKKVTLFQPPLSEVAKVLQDALSEYFSEASVCSTNCPDLTLPPFNFLSKGLGGQCTILDIGSSSYLTPVAKRNKLYDLKDIVTTIGLDPTFILGAGLGPWPHVGVNCEMIANMAIHGDNVINKTQVAHIVQDKCQLDILPSSETRCAILANLLCSKGEPSEVIKIKCKTRKGNEDIITYIQRALQNHYHDKVIGLGGTFTLKNSLAKQHIMPEFASVALETPESIQNWIKFYAHAPPLIAVGTLVSADQACIKELDLKMQHFHGYNFSGDGGHFYSDTQPTGAQYEGYFALGETLYKIDQS